MPQPKYEPLGHSTSVAAMFSGLSSRIKKAMSKKDAAEISMPDPITVQLRVNYILRC